MDEKSNAKNFLPAFVLMILAPIITEILPGSTRFSSLFVFPVQVFVWGGGALLIRYIVRRYQLGWIHLLFLALALSIAEEFLIQQTSLAPMVIKIKGVEYARALGINYVYLLWALIYEVVFVVFLPVYLTELIFYKRRNDLWLKKRGMIIVISLFLLGSYLAWYSWTQIARPNVFHVPFYNPPFAFVILAIFLIGILMFFALGPYRKLLFRVKKSLVPLQPWVLTIIGGFWAFILFGIVLLAFGIAPFFPPVIPVITGLLLTLVTIYWLPRWINHSSWSTNHTYAVIFGTILGSMMAGFIGFIGAAPMDLYFKILINILAFIFLIRLGIRVMNF